MPDAKPYKKNYSTGLKTARFLRTGGPNVSPISETAGGGSGKIRFQAPQNCDP